MTKQEKIVANQERIVTKNKKTAGSFFSISLMTIRKWHWMSAALCFICMLLFSVTGITLHHSKIFLPKPTVTLTEGQLPVEFLPDLGLHLEQKKLGLPVVMVEWFDEKQNIGVITPEPKNIDAKPMEGKVSAEKNSAEKTSQVKNAEGKNLAEKGEIKDGEIKPVERNNREKGPDVKDGKLRIAQNRPGEATALTINLASGAFTYEVTDKGWLAYLNDLHKGKNTGDAWVYFIDIFAIACIIFSITGFLLLQRYANTRAKTWPLLIAGLVLPVFFMMFLIH